MHFVNSYLQGLEISCHSNNVPIQSTYLKLVIGEIRPNLFFISFPVKLAMDWMNIKLCFESDHFIIELFELFWNFNLQIFDFFFDKILHLLLRYFFIRDNTIQVFFSNFVWC